MLKSIDEGAPIDGSALTATATAAAGRARFLSAEDGFNIVRPRQVPHRFDTECRAAFAAEQSCVVALDQSHALELPWQATTPLLLSQYVRLTTGAPLALSVSATSEVYVVLKGQGSSEKGEDRIDWHSGDVFCLPGGGIPTLHMADDAVLWMVCDEPALRFLGAAPPNVGHAPIDAVHYPAESIRAELDGLRHRKLPPTAAARAMHLSSTKVASARTCTPALTVTFNLLGPGERQTPHRHNAVALNLVLDAGGCRSVIEDEEMVWIDNTMLVTPPGDMHEHFNAPAGDWALVLIVQDGGLYYHCRTMGFGYGDETRPSGDH